MYLPPRQVNHGNKEKPYLVGENPMSPPTSKTFNGTQRLQMFPKGFVRIAKHRGRLSSPFALKNK